MLKLFFDCGGCVVVVFFFFKIWLCPFTLENKVSTSANQQYNSEIILTHYLFFGMECDGVEQFFILMKNEKTDLCKNFFRV